jgi:pectate lyase
MTLRYLLLSALLLTCHTFAATTESPALGFGANARGGTGGRVLVVTRLDDDVQHPRTGSLRWALGQTGPRNVVFAVCGDVKLKDRIVVREHFLTLDGGSAPALGVCVRGGSLEFSDTHDIIVRNLRVRLGDETVLKQNRQRGLKRPKGSNGLDCINIDHCRNVLIDHCSLSWCCDELVSVVHSRGVTVQWCILSEPLGRARLHPYGDNHAFAFNASASTLSVHHCLFTRYVMRGPQFEANDMRAKDDYTVRMEAVNNVLCDYTRSGSRYTTGVEDHKAEARGKRFEFQFINNAYLTDHADRPVLEPVTKHGTISAVRVAAVGNVICTAKSIHTAPSKGPAMSHRALFSTSATARVEPAEQAMQAVLHSAGASQNRDAVDVRVINEVRHRRFAAPISSQRDVGGWPKLDGSEGQPEGLARRLFVRRFVDA